MRAGFRNTVLPALVVSALPSSVRAQGRGVPSGVAFYSAREGNNEIFDPDRRRRVATSSSPPTAAATTTDLRSHLV